MTGADAALTKEIHAASGLVGAKSDRPALDLFGDAQAEYGKILSALYGSGHYGPVVHVLIDGREAASIAPLDAPASIKHITVTVDPGPAFRFSEAQVAPLARHTKLPSGFAVGKPAESGMIKAAVATGLDGVALSAFLVVRADELDFTVVEPLSAIVLLIGLVGLFGIALTLIDEQLRRRLPAVTPGRAGALLVYLLISGVGLLFMPMTLQTYFGGGDLLTRKASPEVGLAILAVGLATLAAWVLRVRTGSSTRPRALRIAGQGALAIAVVLGALHLGREIAAILGATS